jgi:ATP-binding protein involved in chromosome partitioning
MGTGDRGRRRYRQRLWWARSMAPTRVDSPDVNEVKVKEMTEPAIAQEEVFAALSRIEDPDLGRDIVALGFVRELRIDGGDVSFAIELTTPACPVRDQMKEDAHRAVRLLPGVESVEVRMGSKVRATGSEGRERLVPLVKHVVPVGSGKGGVGKSTVSANLAIALAKLGAKVGLMDADVYGPSIPTIMGAHVPPTGGNGNIIPVRCYGVEIVSIGFFVPKGEATIWRGPMLSKLVEKFLAGVEWGELDYLLVDLPPGTGDVQLSLCQLIPLTGAAVVSTPQDLAFNVAEKAISMFSKLRTPILGLVENMSGFECRNCGQREEIFGSGGARRFAMANGIPFLGEIPLCTDIRTTSDEGCPIVESMPESPAALAFLRVAENLAAQVSTLTLGGVSSDRPEIAEITRHSTSDVRILWKDGHESIYTGYALRAGCRCAVCVDEMSGNKRLREESISRDVRPLSIDPVGRYAIRFQWSDGHSTGIYPFELLRELCPCPICAQEARRKHD